MCWSVIDVELHKRTSLGRGLSAICGSAALNLVVLWKSLNWIRSFAVYWALACELTSNVGPNLFVSLLLLYCGSFSLYFPRNAHTFLLRNITTGLLFLSVGSAHTSWIQTLIKPSPLLLTLINSKITSFVSTFNTTIYISILIKFYCESVIPHSTVLDM